MDLPLITRPDVVVPVATDPSGRSGPTPRQARGRAWRRTSPNRYVPAGTPRTTDQRIVEAAVGAPGAAVTGWAALYLWGGSRWFSGVGADGATGLLVPMALDDQRRIAPRAGVQLVEDWLFDDDVVRNEGIRLVVPERAVSHVARRARGLILATQAIDMAAYHDLIDLDGFERHVARLPSRPGVRQLRAALAAAEENAWSPQETTMRLLWKREHPGCHLLSNTPVFDQAGNHLFTPDLLDLEHRVAGEYNGRLHLAPVQRRTDVIREETYRAHGFEVVTMVAGDSGDPDPFARRLYGAHDRAQRLETGVPCTLDQPWWWVDTSTVARRRALGDAARARWLRHRAA